MKTKPPTLTSIGLVLTVVFGVAGFLYRPQERLLTNAEVVAKYGDDAFSRYFRTRMVRDANAKVAIKDLTDAEIVMWSFEEVKQ